MATFCRITGKSRGLPKPNYFPLLPPISPADAKRFCRITGKSYGLPSHHYIPVLVGKPRSKKSSGGRPHVVLKGYAYMFPCLETSPDLEELLSTKPTESPDKYVYTVVEKKCGLVFPAKLEAAVRDGDVKDVMLARDSDTVLLKLKKGGDVSLEMKEINVTQLKCKLFDGEGTAKIMKAKKNKNVLTQMFEDKDLKEENAAKKAEKKERKVGVRSWKNVQESSIENVLEEVTFNKWEWDKFDNVNGTPAVDVLPQPIVIEPINIDLGKAVPGIVKQPVIKENLIGLEETSIIAPFRPLIVNPDKVLFENLKNLDPEQLDRTSNVEAVFRDSQDKLPRIEDIPHMVHRLQNQAEIVEEKDGKCVHGLKVETENGEVFVVGQTIETSEGPRFVAGQTVRSSSRDNFVPGFTVATGEGIKLMPGICTEVEGGNVFVAGQIALTRDGERFVQGQTISTKEGQKFVAGQTVLTSDGFKFVAGQLVDERFLPGQTIITDEGPRFVSGQTIKTQEGVKFIPGQSAWSEKGWQFTPGKCIAEEDCVKFVPGRENADNEFIPGQYIKNDSGESIFVPGIVSFKDGAKFVPGTTIETPEGPQFVQGQIISCEDGLKFKPGLTTIVNGQIQFEPASSCEEIIFEETYCTKELEPVISQEECSSIFGHMVQSPHGVEFFPGSAQALPAGKVVPGKLVRGQEVKFIPGIIKDGVFVPGQAVMTDSGEQFIPGQVVETTDGPKFVPGQIINTSSGQKFIPGQTVITEDGPKFVPGQIVETKVGPTFIPGQVIYTEEEGSKFVPGQVIDTSEGPRFVPGRVVETGDQVSFIPGQVVETSEGLRFVAPDFDDDDADEFMVQGFDISAEELSLIQPNSLSTNAIQAREMAIDSKILRQLSEAGMSIGRQVPTDIPVVNVRSLPAMGAACSLGKKLSLDPVTTAKISQIMAAVPQLVKVGEVKGNTEESHILNTILERVAHCKSEEDTYKLVSKIIETEINHDLLNNIDKLYAFMVSEDSPLKRLNKVNLLKEVINCGGSNGELLDKLSIILNDEDSTVSYALKNLSETNPEIVDCIVQRVFETVGELESEKEATETLHRAVVSAVREASEMNIVNYIKDEEHIELKSLILEAVGLAKALDMHDTAVGLLQILSNPKCTNILAGDRVTLEILRRLTIMKQLAEKRPELSSAIKNLQVDPYSARNDPSLKQLVRESAALLVIPEEGISSENVPTSLFFSQNSLAMEEFLTRTKRVYKILVIIKNGIQAIIPREAAHSVLTGTVPYAVLDEKGLHYFEPKHVFSALRLPKIAMGWYSLYKCDVKTEQLNSDDFKSPKIIQ